ncbi:hypothetical protein OH786_00305 [Streptomyces atratus]|uniref:hypothetical protein n=1 Tax=Streptomyces atratus TaxID=1893 RepID=UPI003254BC07
MTPTGHRIHNRRPKRSTFHIFGQSEWRRIMAGPKPTRRNRPSAAKGADAAAQAREIFGRADVGLVSVGAVHGESSAVTMVVEVSALAAVDLLVQMKADAFPQ